MCLYLIPVVVLTFIYHYYPNKQQVILMVTLGSGQYFPKKYDYKKKIFKNPKGWGTWFTQPRGSQSVEVVYYKKKPKKSALKEFADMVPSPKKR